MNQKQEKSTSDRLIRAIAERTGPLVVAGMGSSAGARLAAGVRQVLKSPVLVVAASTKAAEQRKAEIDFFSGETGSAAVLFPPYNISPVQIHVLP